MFDNHGIILQHAQLLHGWEVSFFGGCFASTPWMASWIGAVERVGLDVASDRNPGV